MAMEDSGKTRRCKYTVFLKPGVKQTDDFERFYCILLCSPTSKKVFSAELKMVGNIFCSFALKLNDDSVKSAFPIAIFLNIAKCHEELCAPWQG